MLCFGQVNGGVPAAEGVDGRGVFGGVHLLSHEGAQTEGAGSTEPRTALQTQQTHILHTPTLNKAVWNLFD